jgi:hypothetical protein
MITPEGATVVSVRVREIGAGRLVNIFLPVPSTSGKVSR